MKKSLLLSLVLATSISYAPQTIAAEDSMSLRICEYVSINDKKRLRKYLKSSKVKVRGIFDSIKCNDKNLLVFAASSNALDVGEFLIGKLPVKKISASLNDIKAHSAHLTKIANDRIN